MNTTGKSQSAAAGAPARFPAPAPLLLLLAALLAFAAAGCSDRDPAELEIAHAVDDPVVFADDLIWPNEVSDTDVYFQPFSGTYAQAVGLDTVYAYAGRRSMMVTVPPEGSPLGDYAGGVLTAVAVRELAGYNALTFRARADANIDLDEVGFGNDNTGESLYTAGIGAVNLFPSWQEVVIPIPNSDRLIAERGLFTFAEGAEPSNRDGYRIWFDQIEFAQVDDITDPRPFLPSVEKESFVGASAGISGCYTTFAVNGRDVQVNHMPGYFDFEFSTPGVAVVDRDVVRIVGVGSTVVTASLAGVPAAGSIVLEGQQPPSGPAPAPTAPQADVVSLFSDVYQNQPVMDWAPNWQYSTAVLEEYRVGGDNTLMYSSLNFVGVDFRANTVDASDMNYFHLDVYAAQGSDFGVKIVVFNEDNGYLVDQAELTFDSQTDPAFVSGGWSSLDIPMSDFGLTLEPEHVGQLVFSTSDATLVLVDNVYWRK